MKYDKTDKIIIALAKTKDTRLALRRMFLRGVATGFVVASMLATGVWAILS